MPLELDPDSFQRRADALTRARTAQRMPGVEYGVAFVESDVPVESSNDSDSDI